MSILHFIEGYRQGGAWETLCVECYRIRYKDAHYTEIPATHGGDAGIEGFTQTGVVNQCYCPEREYSDDELYNHLRDKMTTDIGKFIEPAYIKRLVALGVPPVHEWHFVIPEYRDARIIQHAEVKKREVMNTVKVNPSAYPHIASDFCILIKCADEFKVEISRIIRTNLTDMKLNLAVVHIETPDWDKCPSKQVQNIQRKIKAIRESDEEDEDYKILVNYYIKSYLKGVEIMNHLRLDAPDIHASLLELEQSCKDDVSVQTRTITPAKANGELFNQILNDFENKLKEEFGKTLTLASIGEIKQDLVASWLGDCSMEFRRRDIS